MKKVLIILSSYLPGFRSGGPQRTIENVCDNYSKKCDIYIFTLNHDHNDMTPYDLPIDQWIERYGINIKYVKDVDYGIGAFKELYNEFDTIYACSLFDKATYEMILINRLSKEKKKLYVAPMGVLSEGALSSKLFKKKMFLNVFSWIGAFKNIDWSFTSEIEYEEAQKAIGKKNIVNYIIAEDLPKQYEWDVLKTSLKASDSGVLKIVFLSRIVKKKNLLFCAKILSKQFNGKIIFDIYGSQEDPNYWNICDRELSKCISNIHISYKGEVKPEAVIDIFHMYDCFLFPTMGENFGHVIYEALSAGCIPVISDKTPWIEIANDGCGFVAELDDVEQFVKYIDVLLNMGKKDLFLMKQKAVEFAKAKYEKTISVTGYNKVFIDGHTK